MSASTANDQFDWGGPASKRKPKSLVVRFRELFVPPKGEKVLPTGSGMMLILVGLCLGLAAYNTENNILFASLALLLALIVIGVQIEICYLIILGFYDTMVKTGDL